MTKFHHELEDGHLVWWTDPDEGTSSGLYKVTTIADVRGEPREVDTLVVIVSEQGSEAEVSLSELSPPPARHAWGIPRERNALKRRLMR